MTVWYLIERDHRNIAYLLREIAQAAAGRGVIRNRGRLMGDLIEEVEAHGQALDASVLDASVLDALGGDEGSGRLVSEVRDEHDRILRRLGALARASRGGGSPWQSDFADTAFLLDQHLHRHDRELLPLARARLSPSEVDAAGRAFVRAKAALLRRRRSRIPGTAQGSEVFLVSAVGVATAALALLAWRTGFFGRPEDRGPPAQRSRDLGRERSRDDLAAAAAPPDRRLGEDLAQRQDRLLDEALEETFPASDPISPKQITR